VATQASVSRIGHATTTANVNAIRENQRPGPLPTSGLVYIGFASHADTLPYHGWVLAYNATTLQQVMVYNSTPDGHEGGIWQSGGGLATDATGNIFFTSGNGNFDAATGGRNYSNSVENLSPSGSVVDYFTPYNESYMTK